MITLNVSPFVRFSTLALSIALVSALPACDDSGSGGSGGGGAGGEGTTTTTTTTSGSTTTTTVTENPYDTAAKINAYLEGKTLTMAGADIPSDPNGYNENVNFGQATQCYNKTVMMPAAAAWHVESTLGTLSNAPNTGDVGTCEHDKPGTTVMFDSTAILVENVSADCFDFTATYVGFGQEGRGSISADGKVLKLEIFFKDQATGHRCGDGAVGAKSVKLSGADFAGNAVQTYQIK